MYSKGRHPGIQQLICILYIIGLTLMALFIFFSEDERPRFSTMLAATIGAILLSVIFTLIPKLSDHVHAMLLTEMGLLVTIINAVCVRNPVYLNYGIVICALIMCLYEEPAILKSEMISSVVAFVLTGIHFGANHLLIPYGVGHFVWSAIFLTLAQFVLIYLTEHVKLYRQVIRDNSMSSQDMLRVVEMKRKEAQEATRAKSLFLSNMSHEIRTPINAILGMDEIILRDSNEENVLEYAGKIQSAGNTLLSLINDILDFSKIESGRMELLPEEYDTADIFRETYDMICLRMEEKGLKLIFDVSPKLPRRLYGDPLRIKQVLTNVLNNAVKYTEKGSVTLRVTGEMFLQDRVRLMIEVADTGIGIRPEDRDRIFESFERVDADRTKHIEGTGLGMAITKQLLGLMDGEISVDSEYGKGSTFKISLIQKVVDTEEMGWLKVGDSSVDPKRYRKKAFAAPEAELLVVDDNEMNLVVVKGLLKKCKARTDLATSGRQCLSMVTEKHYDLIFMDHMMPELDGIETFRQMRGLENSRCKDTPVIVLTANAVMGAREMYLEEGFCDYLPKPIHGEELEAALLRYLPPERICPVKEEKQPALKKTVPKLAGIDYARGLSYAAGDEEQYHTGMTVFYRTAREKHALLKNYLAAEDLPAYTIEVHALKSNARYIGADVLGELAYSQEKAAKAGDIAFLKEHWDEMIAEWDIVLGAIESYLHPQEEKIAESGELPIDREIYHRKVEKVLAALKSYEIDEAQNRLRDLLNYALTPAQSEAVHAAMKAADDFAYEKAGTILTQSETD